MISKAQRIMDCERREIMVLYRPYDYNAKRRFQMRRIKQFSIKWGDAWFRYDKGYVSALVTDDDVTQIDFMVNSKPFTIDITGREDEFVDKLEECGVPEMDGYEYYHPDIPDGTVWTFEVAYDDKVIEAVGTNAYPKPCISFMDYLHTVWKLPMAPVEEVVDESEEYKKATVRERMEGH